MRPKRHILVYTTHRVTSRVMIASADITAITPSTATPERRKHRVVSGRNVNHYSKSRKLNANENVPLTP